MERPKYLAWMHGAGVGFSVVAMFIGGVYNPGIGFPVAVAVLIALEIPSPPKLSDKKILRIIYGTIKKGGIRRGIFIKEIFTGAVIYLALASFALGMMAVGLSNALLGVGLVVSTIASEIEAKAMRKAIE